MVATLVVLLIIGLIVIGILVNPLLIRQRRNRLKYRSFPPLWNAIIENQIPIYLRLSPDERRRLQGHIQVFLSEKQFIGCAGLQVTEEMRLIIAAIACLLQLNERGTYFPNLRSILVYPDTYLANVTTTEGNVVVEERRVARLGESWNHDQLVLSWNQIIHDTNNWTDGQNVVLHEFAHQLDQEDGNAEGVPILQDADYSNWTTVMSKEYQRLCKDVESGARTVMDSYGTTNPAEFFAVATETFFEKPLQLMKRHPALYEQLQHYYQLNPMQWVKNSNRKFLDF